MFMRYLWINPLKKDLLSINMLKNTSMINHTHLRTNSQDIYSIQQWRSPTIYYIKEENSHGIQTLVTLMCISLTLLYFNDVLSPLI